MLMEGIYWMVTQPLLGLGLGRSDALFVFFQTFNPPFLLPRLLLSPYPPCPPPFALNKLCTRPHKKCAVHNFNQSYVSNILSLPSSFLPGVAFGRAEPGRPLHEAGEDVGGDGLGRVADAQGDDLGRRVRLQKRTAAAADLGE